MMNLLIFYKYFGIFNKNTHVIDVINECHVEFFVKYVCSYVTHACFKWVELLFNFFI